MPSSTVTVPSDVVDPDALDTLSRLDSGRLDRYAARAWLTARRGRTSLPRLHRCGRYSIGEQVTVRRTADGSGFAGLETCGSVWACPSCSARISETRRRDLHQLLSAHLSTRWSVHHTLPPLDSVDVDDPQPHFPSVPVSGRGVDVSSGGVLFATLTAAHRWGTPLDVQWDRMLDAWRRCQQGRGWKVLRDRAGVIGSVALREATVTSNGWHLHLHVLFLTAGDASRLVDPVAVDGSSRLEVFRTDLVDRWATVGARVGLVVDEQGQDVRALHGPGAAGHVADYFAKATYEVARSDLKSARGDGLAPFALLRLLVSGELPDGVSPLVFAHAEDLWREWEQGSRGRRQVGYSRGLRRMYELGVEATDEDIVAEDVGGSPVVHVPGDVWRRDLASRPRRLVRIHLAVEAASCHLDAVEAVCALLDAWGLLSGCVPVWDPLATADHSPAAVPPASVLP